LEGPLRYDLVVEGVGSWRVAVDGNGGGARVERVAAGANGAGVDFELVADAEGIAALAARESPLKLMASGKLKLRGKRRRALKLRAMGDGPEPTIADALAAGAELDVDAIYRSLGYMIDPEWTRGHSFTVAYVIRETGSWYVKVSDGAPVTVSTEDSEADARLTLSLDTYRGLLTGSMTPSEAMHRHLIHVEGELYPTTLLGRWIDRSQGRDDAELAREERQRALQERRRGSWGGARGNGTPLPAPRPVSEADGGDPAHEDAGAARRGSDLMGYGELYALWERQNWRAHELDFSVDREQWLASPTEAQQHTTWSLGSFYIGEERVTADLAPFLIAAPSGEVEVFLATQLVDEARHAAFFDRFGAEVMALDSDDMRGRLAELGALMERPWFDVFDDGLREVAERIKANPDDMDLFVEGITTYHMVVEGFLAVTGQTLIRDYMLEHSMYPGFCEGFGLVERDEHRHVAFGVRFLRDAIEEDARHRETVERVVLELAPKAAYVFVPPYVDDPSDFTSYGYTSRQIYGFAYRTLKRRMKVLGIEIPPPEELLPGPIEGAAPPAVEVQPAKAAAPTNGAGSNGSGDLEAAATS
ncbi:MAG: ribonucleoside-diphosphate reductase beta chain, partial [Thermoleophilaceae bacterium]|nr:ribonucleoside-diphosphate reductase beta chain [Thermoleophilaceae bacterium]